MSYSSTDISQVQIYFMTQKICSNLMLVESNHLIRNNLSELGKLPKVNVTLSNIAHVQM